MLVTILIPCHNEQDALVPLFNELERLPRLLTPEHFPEVVCVDDGSTDDSARLLRSLCDRTWFPVRVLSLSPNQGLGAAIREGVVLATGDVVVTYDADRAYPLEDLKEMLALISGGADMVTASPWHPSGKSEPLPFHRRLLSVGASWAYRLRFGPAGSARIHTYTCGYRAYRRDVLLRCLPRRNDFVATAEILVRALREGLMIKELPSTLRARTEGQSKMRLLRTIRGHLGLLFRGS